MLYFVSVNGIDADYPLDDYDNFIVEADSELINAIAEAIDAECDEGYYDDITLDDYDGSIW